MGEIQKARLHSAGGTIEGVASLETAELIFRGDSRGVPRLVIPFSSIKSVEASDGLLKINGSIVLELGAPAIKWSEKILNPKSVVQKLGIKSGQRVAVVRLDDPAFCASIENSGASVSTGRPKKNSDAIFLGADTREELERIATLKESLAPRGALWVVRPRGVKQITEVDVRAAGKAAGLVDVKVVRFSDTHTAEKFVIPLARR